MPPLGKRNKTTGKRSTDTVEILQTPRKSLGTRIPNSYMKSFGVEGKNRSAALPDTTHREGVNIPFEVGPADHQTEADVLGGLESRKDTSASLVLSRNSQRRVPDTTYRHVNPKTTDLLGSTLSLLHRSWVAAAPLTPRCNTPSGQFEAPPNHLHLLRRATSRSSGGNRTSAFSATTVPQ